MTSFHADRNVLALAAVCFASLMVGLEISSVPVILPTLQRVMHADFKQLQWIMNAYTIGCTTVLMGIGALADRYGRKRISMISIMAFGITSLICGLTRDASVLILARFLQGMSGGAMLICHVAVLSHQFQDERERGKAFGWWGIAFGAGLGFGPIIGGAIVALFNWKWVFFIHVLIAVATLFLAIRGVRESKDPVAERLDIAGIATLSVSVFCVAYFITQGPDLGFASPTALGIIGVAVMGFFAFLFAEKINPRPMLDFSVFKVRRFSGALCGSVGMNLSFWPFMIYLPIYFQSCLGYDVVSAGLSLLAYTLPTLVIPPLAERLSLRYQPRIIIPSGMFTIGLGFLLMKFGAASENASWLSMLPGALLAGIGLGLTNTPVTNTTTGSVDSARAGMASSIDISARLISLAINIAVMGFLLQKGIQSYLKGVLPAAFDAAQLRSFSELIAAGNSTSTHVLFKQLSSMGATKAIVHGALGQGFSVVMLYGALSVWGLALISFVTFGSNGARSDGLKNADHQSAET
jgi:EmrB/QacA subfamily drug resistance transporter